MLEKLQKSIQNQIHEFEKSLNKVTYLTVLAAVGQTTITYYLLVLIKLRLTQGRNQRRACPPPVKSWAPCKSWLLIVIYCSTSITISLYVLVRAVATIGAWGQLPQGRSQHGARGGAIAPPQILALPPPPDGSRP